MIKFGNLVSRGSDIKDSVVQRVCEEYISIQDRIPREPNVTEIHIISLGRSKYEIMRSAVKSLKPKLANAPN